jgi:uncharacterized protein
MKFNETFHYWREALLSVAIALPWLCLVVLGSLWLWQGGYFFVWSVATAGLALLAWPLSISVQRSAKGHARVALASLAEPSRCWNSVERDAWAAVLEIADTAAPLSFAELEPLLGRARETVEIVARRFHPEAHTAWAQFTLPEVLLLTERLSRDVRREALRQIPGVGLIQFSHLFWVHEQNKRYGAMARTGWRMSFGLWRLVCYSACNFDPLIRGIGVQN